MQHFAAHTPRRRPLKKAGTIVLTVLAAAGTLLAGACDDDDDIVQPGDGVIDLELVAEGLVSPVLLREAPDGSGRLFIVDQIGTIRIVTEDGTLESEPFLDLRDRMIGLMTDFDERGLLGLAFHPDYANNGRFFVYYSAPLRGGAPNGWDHTSHISEFTVSGDADRADPGSERVVLQVDQPQFNHNAGTIEFGPDGYLYIALGDGGGSDDTGIGHVTDWYDTNDGGNGQDIEENLLGSILRIDVDDEEPYAIPADNPFVGEDGRGEIWAYGFRNPYRFSFDTQTGDLIVGDVGQNLWEEVNLVEEAGNYGWNVKEGAHCFDASDPENEMADCPNEGALGEPLIDPVIEYGNVAAGGLGVAVIGGYVYRGDDIPDLDGAYVFGDFSRSGTSPDGVVFVAERGGQSPWAFEELRFGDSSRALGAYVRGFGQDAEGEIYVLTSTEGGPSGTSGKVYRLAFVED
jgi:glucose/arabinose dehydrogenase